MFEDIYSSKLKTLFLIFKRLIYKISKYFFFIKRLSWIKLYVCNF